MSNTSNIIMHFDKKINLCIKLAFKEFCKWLRNNINFSVKINVYISNEYRVICKDFREATGIFGTPSTRNKYPYIRLATADFNDLKDEIGYYNGMISLLHTFAHEIIHYQQWVKNKAFNEKLADKEANKLVNEYSDYKMGFLTVNKGTLELIKKAYAYYNMKDYNKSIKYFNRIALERYDFDVILKDIGDIYSTLNCYEKAVEFYNKSIALNERDYDTYINKGYALDMLSRFDDAICSYDHAISLNPEDELGYLNKGYSLFSSNKLLESINYFDKVIEINQEHEDAFIFKAQALERLSKFGESIANYNLAIKINSKNSISLLGKGMVLFALGKYKECIEIIKKGIQIDASNADSYYYLALSFLALNQFKNCIINLKKSIELDQKYKEIAKHDNQFNHIKDQNAFINIVI